ncbi:MAG TPA: hypothetical protein DCM05_00945 [Elusimicrobia bacterium]|nr:hypothetical protein [Elusimicrobiota bacterium]
MRASALLTALLLGARLAHASAGEEPFSFLFIDAGARAAAMGGAYTALARDSNALLYNPAGLSRIEKDEATFMHNEHFAGVAQEYAAFALKNGIGGNLNYVNLGSMPRTTISNPGGAGDFSAWDLALSGGYGRRLSEALGAGAGLKLIREAIDDESATGVALDMGALYSVQDYPGLDLGLAVQNLGPSVRFQSESETLPVHFRTGAAYSFTAYVQPSALAVDFSKELSEEAAVALGAETVAAKALALRLGFNTRNAAGYGVSVGLGWVLRDFSLDYVFIPYGELGDAHRFSLTCRWGGGESRPEPVRTLREPPPAPKPPKAEALPAHAPLPPAKPPRKPAEPRKGGLIEITE